MDTARLKSTVDILIKEEEELQIQQELQEIVNSLSNISINPAEPSYQVQLRDAADALKKSLSELVLNSQPTYVAYGPLIGAPRFFSLSLLDEITAAINQNGITPSVARDEVQAVVNGRKAYLQRLHALTDALSGFGIGADDLPEGQTQIGFRVPRRMFDNRLSGWITELNEIKGIVRPLSELATGSAEPLELGEVSSTDPIVFLIANAATVALAAQVVSWGLDQWKKFEEIRNIKAQTAKINEDQPNDLAQQVIEKLDLLIEQQISQCVIDKATELVRPADGAGRHHELITDMQYALRSLLARLERGMSIEIKMLLQPAEIEQRSADDPISIIEHTLPKLVFPAASKAPTISLPRNQPHD